MVRMAVESSVSKYYRSLDLVAKKRYKEKLSYSKGTKTLPNPYAFSDGWSENPNIALGDIFFT